ncbi:siderophore-interacting protein [Paracoccus onubensis]|uniref:Siderophore-interacting protein n=1 Tax=Paracoccus onubensis TaxID=1675788 RepID=A0A418SVI8_9RHOB|nr:siderophore-interacting protein [Paracoccus onubensis]RJE84966.1 siderophore-interacting protein [Paracoccus onubensis]
MTELICHARLTLPNNGDYIDAITDRLASFQAQPEPAAPGVTRLRYAFGWAEIAVDGRQVSLCGGAPDPDGLARLKDLMATAFKLYAKTDVPQIRWQGDGADDRRLDSFRLMRVISAGNLTPHMRRIRLSGEGLDRFAAFGNMHVRLLLPSDAVPAPVWPVAGTDGLACWPDPDRRPLPRVYTIRRMDAAAGWVDIDMLMHDSDGPGASWARNAQPGEPVGMIGPLGRPLNSDAQHFIMGADEAGLPALARLLETLPPAVTGTAFIEITSANECQPIDNRTGIRVEWLLRDPNSAPGEKLAGRIMTEGWPDRADSFGWFAAEAGPALTIRHFWRSELGLGRNQTLAAAYWKRGRAGLMAG